MMVMEKNFWPREEKRTILYIHFPLVLKPFHGLLPPAGATALLASRRCLHLSPRSAPSLTLHVRDPIPASLVTRLWGSRLSTESRSVHSTLMLAGFGPRPNERPHPITRCYNLAVDTSLG